MSTEGLPGAVEEMSDPLSPREAARLLADASTFEDALQQRTEGLTQMTWGLVTAAIFVTYGFAAVLGAGDLAFSLLWAPWVAAGVLTTLALWRSAALVRPASPAFGRPPGLLRVLAVNLLFLVLFALLQPDGPTLPLAIVGVVWTVMSLANVYRSSPRGRLLLALCGMTFLGTAAALAAFRAPIEVSGTISIVVSGAVPLATGLWQTLRG